MIVIAFFMVVDVHVGIVVNLFFCIHSTIALTACFPVLDNCHELASHACEEVRNSVCSCCSKTSNGSMTAINLRHEIRMAT
jgi:hypothetical protein